MYNIFVDNGFSVIKVNFRGVKSEGVFDNGQGLSDQNFGLDRETEFRLQPLLSGFSFGSLICMQLIIEDLGNNFIAISPQPNVWFLE